MDQSQKVGWYMPHDEGRKSRCRLSTMITKRSSHMPTFTMSEMMNSIGTLNEFTIAYDEGKIIGIVEGTGGVADQVRAIVHALTKKTGAALFFERDAVVLLRLCLAELARRKG